MPENTDAESRMGEQMNRRELREQIFMLLFRVEFNQKDDMPEQCTLFLEDGDTEISEKDAAYIRSKYEKLQRNCQRLIS